MALTSNEVLNKRVIKLFEVCNGRCWQFTEPHPSSSSLECGGKGLAYYFIRGLLEIQNCLESPYMVKAVFCAVIELHCERRNFGGKGHSKTLAVKGESVLLSMPSRFIAVFPFMAFFTSSSSLFRLFII